MALPSHIKPTAGAAPSRQPVFALVGNPNCGKSTLFNALTGLKQKIGNYPGVTVEKKVGTTWSQHGQLMTVIDLPGAYSLAARSPDEAVTRDVLLGRRADTPQPDRILCIVDATNLERNLYLVHQILDLGRPVILVLNMMDVARESGLRIRTARLEHELGIPVIPCEAVNGKGLVELRLAMSRTDLPLSRHAWDIPAAIAPAVSELQASLAEHGGRSPLVARAEALLLLTDQDSVRVAGSKPLPVRTGEILAHWQKRWSGEGTDWAASLVTSRYDAIGRLCAKTIEQQPVTDGPSRSDRIDAVVTHPVWGWLVLGGIMTLLFLSIFTFAEYPMNWIDGHVAGVSDFVKAQLDEGDLRDLITDGAIAGVGGVIIFLPQILILFFFIGLLESTGYMARAAFIMDRLMSRVGLNGKSFIPLLSSYACAIPGVLATRTIDSAKERLVTIFVAPWMSCSARLPVYLLLVPMLLGGREGGAVQALVFLGIYVLGTATAFFVARVLRGRLGPDEVKSHFLLELPPYRLPQWSYILRHVLERGWSFLRKAGTFILALMVLLWAAITYPKLESDDPAEVLAHTVVGRISRAIEPVVAPLGFDGRTGTAILTSFAAREVFVGSMAQLFQVEESDDEAETRGRIRARLAAETRADGRPLFGAAAVVSLLVFYIYALQCLPTSAVVARESGSWKWAAGQFVFMMLFAYLASLAVYQGARLLGLG